LLLALIVFEHLRWQRVIQAKGEKVSRARLPPVREVSLIVSERSEWVEADKVLGRAEAFEIHGRTSLGEQ
jgi:alkylated DNA nucleotide flippase Atl1